MLRYVQINVQITIIGLFNNLFTYILCLCAGFFGRCLLLCGLCEPSFQSPVYFSVLKCLCETITIYGCCLNTYVKRQ